MVMVEIHFTRWDRSQITEGTVVQFTLPNVELESVAES